MKWIDFDIHQPFVNIENDCFPVYESKQDKVLSESTWKPLENACLIEVIISDVDRILYFYFENKDIYQQVIDTA